MRVWNGMPATELTVANWRKSSASNPSGSCVELAELPGGKVAMRNSRDKSGPALVYSRAAVAAFLRRLKNGELDGLVSLLSPVSIEPLRSECETFTPTGGKTACGQVLEGGVWLRMHPAAGHPQAFPARSSRRHCNTASGEPGQGWQRKR